MVIVGRGNWRVRCAREREAGLCSTLQNALSKNLWKRQAHWVTSSRHNESMTISSFEPPPYEFHSNVCYSSTQPLKCMYNAKYSCHSLTSNDDNQFARENKCIINVPQPRLRSRKTKQKWKHIQPPQIPCIPNFFSSNIISMCMADYTTKLCGNINKASLTRAKRLHETNVWRKWNCKTMKRERGKRKSKEFVSFPFSASLFDSILMWFSPFQLQFNPIAVDRRRADWISPLLVPCDISWCE